MNELKRRQTVEITATTDPTPRADTTSENETLEAVRDRYASAYENGGRRRTQAVLRRMGANVDLAEELAEAAWCRGLERLDQLKDPKRVVPWVNTTAINMFRDETERNRRMVQFFSAGYELGITASVNVTLLDLDVAIRGCPTRQRALLEDVLAGRTVDELAAGLAISTGAVHHRLSRARRALRAAMHSA